MSLGPGLVMLSREAFDFLACVQCRAAMDAAGVDVQAVLCSDCVARIRDAEPTGEGDIRT